MLDKVCAYARKYAHDGVVQQWSILWFKSHWNGISTQELTTSMHVLNDSFIICPFMFGPNQFCKHSSWHDKGMGREISIVKHDTK
jgi:hypothetical protein